MCIRDRIPSEPTTPDHIPTETPAPSETPDHTPTVTPAPSVTPDHTPESVSYTHLDVYKRQLPGVI